MRSPLQIGFSADNFLNEYKKILAPGSNYSSVNVVIKSQPLDLVKPVVIAPHYSVITGWYSNPHKWDFVKNQPIYPYNVSMIEKGEFILYIIHKEFERWGVFMMIQSSQQDQDPNKAFLKATSLIKYMEN